MENKNEISLVGELNILLQDEDLTNEKLREASESLLPRIANYLNDQKRFFDLIENGNITINDTIKELDSFIERLK